MNVQRALQCAAYCVVILGRASSIWAADPTQAAPQRGADSRTWYQAYSDGRRSIQQGNWQAAVDSLEAAKRASAPKPGRKIPFYGDVYDDFLPDYYLGIAYLNLKRFQEADRAFEAVRASGLITPRDREFAQLDQQTKAAKSGLQLAQAAQPPAAPPTGMSAASANAPGVAPPSVSQQTANQSANPLPSTGQPPPLQSAPAPGGAAPVLPLGTQAGTPPQRNAAGNLATARPTVPAAPNPPVVRPATAGANEQTAIRAYLSGQYDQAASLLNAVVSGAGATPRAYFYLACSQTALAIVGQADAATITSARSILAQAGDQAQFAADKRYISPRVLQMLGAKP